MHEFRAAPYGGSNQFLHALAGEFRRRGLRLSSRVISRRTRGCLLHSYLVDVDRVQRMRHRLCRVVHRVDGPISSYRGWDDGTDTRIERINHALAEVTVFQSRYSLEAHRRLGLELRNPILIPNAADPSIFYRAPELPPRSPIRLIATSWSDNPNKGAATLEWLDRHLDRQRYELTFVGRLPVTLRHARVVPPLGSQDLARLLRQHHIYIAASSNDPCSNALIEGLTCGLPALYLRSGGHPELVGRAGLGFDDPEEIPPLLRQLVTELDRLRASIRVPRLDVVATEYLEALGMSGGREDR